MLLLKLSTHFRWRLTLDTWAGERSREGHCHWQQEVFEPPWWGRLCTSLVVCILMGARGSKIGSFHGIQSKKSGNRQDIYWRQGWDTQLFPYRPQRSILIAKKQNECAMQNKYIYLHDFLLSFPMFTRSWQVWCVQVLHTILKGKLNHSKWAKKGNYIDFAII